MAESSSRLKVIRSERGEPMISLIEAERRAHVIVQASIRIIIRSRL